MRTHAVETAFSPSAGHMWKQYLAMIVEVDHAIAAQLQRMKKITELPPLAKRKHVRGRTLRPSMFGRRCLSSSAST